MTKAEEIKLLDDIIERAPKRSYLRTTLRELRVQFESDIRSDFETMPNLAQMEAERLNVAGQIRSRQLQLSGLETKVRCLRAERERLVEALDRLQAEAGAIQRQAQKNDGGMEGVEPVNSIRLDTLCRESRGVTPPPNQANIFFVMKGGECVLATTIFNVANNLFDAWVSAKANFSAVLADRRIGDLAVYYPATGVPLDRRNEDYYQALKYHVTEQFVREHREKCEREAAEVHQVDKPGQWLVKYGKMSNTYFYVQHVQRNGKLKGFVVYLTHKDKYEGTAMNQTIERADIHDWRVVTPERVGQMRLERYV